MASAIMVHLADWPEALWALRAELAKCIREAAQDEEPRVAERLHAIATTFESGASEDA